MITKESKRAWDGCSLVPSPAFIREQFNFFFENSTRTRMSFEIAGKKMGAKVVNLDISLSSLKKGESITDTALTINAMKPDFVAIRHNSSGIISLLKKYINCSLINAGDGTNEHPSQALLGSFVIKKYKGNLSNLKITLITTLKKLM